MSSFLSTGELAQMRADQLHTLADETCTLLTPTYTANAIGEQTVTWGTMATGVACRLRSLSGAGWDPLTNRPVVNWSVTLPQGTVVDIGDRVVIDSVEYEVTKAETGETW
jgi:hypothetical protein